MTNARNNTNLFISISDCKGSEIMCRNGSDTWFETGSWWWSEGCILSGDNNRFNENPLL